MKQKGSKTVVYNALYLLFEDYCKKTKLSKEQPVDENGSVNFSYSLQMQYKVFLLEELIRDLWGTKCQYLLSGVLIYLSKLDSYFSPKINGFKHFFIKIYKNREILTKIGRGEHKVIFPFKNFNKENKKLVLIRC